MDHINAIPGFNDITNADLSVRIVRVQGPLIVLNLKGLIDTYNTPFLSRKINMAITHGYSKFILDMREITYMSSTGIGIFTSILKSLKAVGGELVFTGLNPKVYEIFELIGFSSFFRFTADITEALKLFRASPEKKVFPKTFRCSCKKTLKVPRPGKFRCPQCKIIIAVNNQGALSRA